MFESKITRGYGLLENYLATQRAKKAKRLISHNDNKDRILDIGCGAYPLFLMITDFTEKYGLDKGVKNHNDRYYQSQRINLLNHDIEMETFLPFESNYFNVVSMLAVLEHIEQEKAINLLREVHRVLQLSGVFVLTVPAVWSKKILEFMAKLRIVSPVEIADHKFLYATSTIISMLREVNFKEENIRIGCFEMFMNRWTTAIK